MTTYLMHSRTKGSKNGVRLYQNKDGTYTELGKERRRKDGGHYTGYGSSPTNTGKSFDELVHPEDFASPASDTSTKNKKWTLNDTKTAIAETGKMVNSSRPLAVFIGKGKDRKINEAAVAEAKKRVKDISDEDLQKINRRLNLEKNYIDLTAPPTHKNEERVKGIFDIASGLTLTAAAAVGMIVSIKTLLNK